MADDNQIDISLSLLSAQQGAAFTTFVQQIAAINASIEAMVTNSAKVQAEMNGHTSASFNGGGGPNASRSTSSGGGQNQRQQGPSPTASTGSPMDEFIRHQLPPGGGAILDAFQGKNLSEPWKSYVDQNRPSPYKVFRERGDDVGVADGLRIAAYAAGKRGSSAMAAVGDRFHAGGAIGAVGRGAGSLGTWAAQNPFTAYYGYQQLKGMAKSHMPATSAMNEGAALGYERGDGSFIEGPGGIGFQIPLVGRYLSPAGRKGLGERFDRIGMRLKAGINGEQAAAIQSALYGQGLTGGDYRDQLEDSMVKLTQRYPGMDQNLTAQMLVDGTKYGGESVKSLADTISGLGDAAKDSSMTMQQLQQSVAQVGGSYKDMGAGSAQGTRIAADWFGTTGQDPAVATQLQHSGYNQAMVTAQTGLPGFAQGLLPASTLNALTLQSVRSQVDMYKGQNFDIPDPTNPGKMIHISGEDYAIGLVAQQNGMDPKKLKQMYQNAGQDQKKATALGGLRDYQSEVDVLKHGNKKDRKLRRSMLTGGPIDANDHVTSWAEVRKNARDNHLLTKKQLDDIDDIKPGGGFLGFGKKSENDVAKERVARFKKYVAENTNKRNRKEATDANVQVDLTDEAKQLIKVKKIKYGSKEKEVAQAGGFNLIDATQGQARLGGHH